MKLSNLIDCDSDLDILYLSEDSCDIKDNTLFFALKGANFDAHTIIDEVIKKGAICIVHTDDIFNKQEGIYYYQVKDINKEMALISAKFYDNPSSKLNLIGVTGTNGKTTIGWVLKELLNQLSSCGYIGTIDVEYGDKVFHNHYTTPKSLELNKYFNDMVNDNINYCALEVSSHALALKRSYGLLFKYAIMTNLTFEHVNFHGSMGKYQEAKRILFENLNSDNIAILNKDDATYQDYAENTNAKVISYGINNDADVMAKDIKLSKDGTSFTLKIFDSEVLIETNMVALFNVYNLLPVLIVLYCEGFAFEDVRPLLKNIKFPTGRVQSIDYGQSFNVIVDYAHTPDGFEKVFEYAKAIAKKRIIAIFGSAGGDRDREKRPVLGEIADKYCDLIILTLEDPRTEKVSDINNMIKKGISNTEVIEIEDRPSAIKYALKHANKDDTVLVLAKADDDYNAIGNDYVYYEGDINIVTRILKEMQAHGIK
ncbi:MAG: UDP-N-acetylmuramoyl-L-alanyl-D-glutamate--2,6-diaminopimelate ligase [Bacilli bacterium]|jgi:UDP-N-acetylmuramoyl-L-alanyl-D-glutamate--2,6-diaminopimelate ligase|nr:UDP-N-acetylmuramoyl-L-alanyl-D-glutamate--2,6-diaminopimelate ligase [Bacilli bacterium]